MRIVVCVKQVIDPEMPCSAFRIDAEAKRALPPQGTPPVLSPFDENALEAALRLKDRHGAEVTAVSMGNRLARPVLRKTLAAGADGLVLLEGPAFEDLDSFASAGVLAAAIRKIGDVDIILTGRQAADWDSGIAGCAVAAELGVPCITVARKVEVNVGLARIERVLPDGFEVVESALPCVVTVDSDLGELRQSNLQSLLAAQKKPLQVWSLEDLDLDSLPPPRCELLELYVPVRETVCQMIGGETLENAAVNLANRLHEESLI